jgi:polypeptide N-acetylgalactosaminyltransferase
MNINFTGWLEPMLYRIGEDKRHVVTPVIESIDADNFKIKMSEYKDIQVGKFDWNMAFSWMLVPNSIKQTLSSQVMPIRFVIG